MGLRWVNCEESYRAVLVNKEETFCHFPWVDEPGRCYMKQARYRETDHMHSILELDAHTVDRRGRAEFLLTSSSHSRGKGERTGERVGSGPKGTGEIASNILEHSRIIMIDKS